MRERGAGGQDPFSPSHPGIQAEGGLAKFNMQRRKRTKRKKHRRILWPYLAMACNISAHSSQAQQYSPDEHPLSESCTVHCTPCLRLCFQELCFHGVVSRSAPRKQTRNGTPPASVSGSVSEHFIVSSVLRCSRSAIAETLTCGELGWM